MVCPAQYGPVLVATVGGLVKRYVILTKPSPLLLPCKQVPPVGIRLDPPPPPPPPNGPEPKQSLPPPPPPYFPPPPPAPGPLL